jgi:hypothetical protein
LRYLLLLYRESRVVIDGKSSKRCCLNQPESKTDKKWATEANRRLAELRSGQAQAIPGDEVFAKVWKRFES